MTELSLFDATPPAPVVSTATRRDMLLARCKSEAAADPTFQSRLKDAWPKDMPTLKSDHAHTASELDALDSIVNILTGVRTETKQRPRQGWLGVSQSAANEFRRRLQVAATFDGEDGHTPPDTLNPNRNVPYEGDTPAEDLVAGYKSLEDGWKGCDKPSLSWLGTLVSQARTAGVSFAFRESGMPETDRIYTIRRFEIMRGLLKLVQAGGDDSYEILRSLVALATATDEPLLLSTPVGAAVGSMDAAEASRFAQQVDALDAGHICPVFEDGEPMRLVETATAAH